MTVEPLAALRDTFLRRIDAHEVYIGIIGQGYRDEEDHEHDAAHHRPPGAGPGTRNSAARIPHDRRSLETAISGNTPR